MNIRVVVDGEVVMEKNVELPTPSPLTASGVWALITSEISAGMMAFNPNRFTDTTEVNQK